MHSLSRRTPGHTENDSLPRRDNLHATAKAVGLAIKSRRFGDLALCVYMKGCTAIAACDVSALAGSLEVYACLCIYARVGNVLYSADPDVG